MVRHIDVNKLHNKSTADQSNGVRALSFQSCRRTQWQEYEFVSSETGSWPLNAAFHDTDTHTDILAGPLRGNRACRT